MLRYRNHGRWIPAGRPWSWPVRLLVAGALAGWALPAAAQSLPLAASAPSSPAASAPSPLARLCRQPAFARTVPVEPLEREAAERHAEVLARARSQNALAPDSHPQVLRARQVLARLLRAAPACNPRAADWLWELHILGGRGVAVTTLPHGKLSLPYGLLSASQADDDELAFVIGQGLAQVLLEQERERRGRAAVVSGGLSMMAAMMGGPMPASRPGSASAAAGPAAALAASAAPVAPASAAPAARPASGSMDASLQAAGRLMSLEHRRRQTLPADALALQLMALAGYDPAAAPRWLARMAALESAAAAGAAGSAAPVPAGAPASTATDAPEAVSAASGATRSASAARVTGRGGFASERMPWQERIAALQPELPQALDAYARSERPTQRFAPPPPPRP